MMLRTIGGKDVYTVESHHHVLEAWAEIRRRLPIAPRLISLDQHTDCLEPFLRHVYAQSGTVDPHPDAQNAARMTLVNSINFLDESTVKRAVELLWNDEHMQAATRSGILDLALVLSFEGTATESEEEKEYEQKYPYWSRRFRNDVPPLPDRPHQYLLPESRIFIVPTGCRVGCTASPHDDNCHYLLSNEVLDAPFLNRQLEWAGEMAASIGISDFLAGPYILDVDLDFFHTDLSLKPKDPSAFHSLIREATAITIAIEAEWTQQCWLDEQPAPVQKMLDEFYSHVEAAMARTE